MNVISISQYWSQTNCNTAGRNARVTPTETFFQGEEAFKHLKNVII
jgi:hypothetical protein